MACPDVGGARIAGSGGIGDGERPVRPRKVVADNDGEAAACEPENDDLLDPGLVDVGGGCMAAGAGCGVDGTDAVGVIGAASRAFKFSANSEADVMTDPFSEVLEARRTMLGREPEGNEGVREWRISMRFAREMGCTSGTPLRKAKVLTWTDLLVNYEGIASNARRTGPRTASQCTR